jgi:hypothetical protein
MTKADKEVLRKIARLRPAATREALERCLGVSIPRGSEIGSGAFRTVYLIPGTRLVAKIPFIDPNTRGVAASRRFSKWHSTQEVKRIEKLRETRFMRKHLPTVRYHNRATGLLIVDYCPPPTPKLNHTVEEQLQTALTSFTRALIKDLTGVDLSDISLDNLSLTASGKIKFIDLGL